jgi:hypothetical protein
VKVGDTGDDLGCMGQSRKEQESVLAAVHSGNWSFHVLPQQDARKPIDTHADSIRTFISIPFLFKI